MDKALMIARRRADGAGVTQRCIFLQENVLALPPGFSFAAALQHQQQDSQQEQHQQHEKEDGQGFDFIFDCQCYHVLHNTKPEQDKFVEVIKRCLKRDVGLYMVITGNANEEALAPVGPARLTREELLAAFPAQDFENVKIEESRFDRTPYYATLAQTPLAWVALFRRK